MTHRAEHSFLAAAALAALVGLAATAVRAQTPLDLSLAQARYEREIAGCNSGTLPAPQREACVRQAGETLDRVRGGPPVPVEATTTDGRATVMTPLPAASRAGSTSASEDLRNTTDGRATVVPSSDGGAIRGTVPAQ